MLLQTLFLLFFSCITIETKNTASLSTLIQRFKSLPTNKELIQENIIGSAEAGKHKGFSDAIEIASEIESWLQMRAQKLHQQNLWQISNQSKTMPDDNFFNYQETIPFTPFVEQVISKPDESFLIRGDLHGDIHSLMTQLEEMLKNGLIDDQFKLKEGISMAFLGDFVDRGNYGIEVLYIVALLGNVNPHNILYTRGNHEDRDMCSDYGFKDEVIAKYNDESLYKEICRMYDFMPTAIYLIDPSAQHCVQLCHGGIEIGYEPNNLLESQKKYQLIGALHQIKNSEKLLKNSKVSEKLKKHITELLIFMEDNLIHASPTSEILPFGHMWNDFDPGAIDPSLFQLKPGRGLEYGQEITDAVLNQSSGDKKIIGIIRGHQHSASAQDTMMQNILKWGGFWNMKKNSRQQTIGDDPCHKDVITLNVAPDTIYGESIGFDYDTALEITPKQNGIWDIKKHTYYPHKASKSS